MAKAPSTTHCPACDNTVSTSAKNCPSCGHQLRKPKRGIFGKIWLLLFWVWNALCGYLFIRTSMNVDSLTTGADGTISPGAVVGSGIAFGGMLFIWLAGAVLLGLFVLFTRPK